MEDGFFDDDSDSESTLDQHALLGEDRSFRLFTKECYQHWVYGKDWRGGISGRRHGIKNHDGKVQRAFKLFMAGAKNKVVSAALHCSGETVRILRKVFVDHTGKNPLCRCGKPSNHCCRCKYNPGPAKRLKLGNRALTIVQWSAELKVPRSRIYHRLKLGLPMEQVLASRSFQGDALRRAPLLPTTPKRGLPPELPPEVKRLHWRKRRKWKVANLRGS